MPETGDAQPHAQKPDVAALHAKFEQAIALHQQARLADAERVYREVLQQQPNHFGALHLLGVIALQTGRMEWGVELIGNAIALKPDYAEAYYNRGKALRKLARFEEALASCNQAITLTPDHAEAHNDRGLVLQDLTRPAEALASYDKAIALKSDYVEAYVNRGNALLDLNRPEDALANYNKAIALKPDLAEAHCNRGNALSGMKQSDAALASYDTAIALKPDLDVAWLARGNTFYDLKRYDEAHAAYDKAIALKPDLAEAFLGHGNSYYDLNRYDEAIAAYAKALALKPGLAAAWLGRGNVFYALKRYDEAFPAYDKALTLNPDLAGAQGLRLHAKLHLCDWRNLDAECAYLIASLKDGNLSTLPFHFLAIPSTSAEKLKCARLWIANRFPPSNAPNWQGERYDHDRIRVAYLSPRFRETATAFLMAGVFECHDKKRFETIAISSGTDDHSAMRKRLKASFDRFIDAESYNDDRIADMAKELEIDIFVDLAGFTEGARVGVFAKRPAPIQVTYLVYPGTVGAPYIDYIIADRILIPKDQREFYAEKVAYLPNSYQPNDAGRLIADRAFTRIELGLPLPGFVFCCFNNNFKITPRVFDCWMRILKQVEGSVLWLFEDNTTAANNLRKEAAARGVNAERLIFATRMPLPDHLARHRLADLFLDTLPYNAHTTASDALWAGLPVLTCLGETFSGRVAASLLNAIGLPELVATNFEAYEQMAIELATHPEKLAAVKRKLADNRLTTPLFDTRLFTKHIEAAYTAMYQRHRAGSPPDHIFIPS
jgi:protein O-GlcNAc transferase